MAESETDITKETETLMQEEYLNSFSNLKEGQLIEGRVIEISSESVFIDIGYKSEGKIPIEEFKTKPEIGDVVNVVLISKEGKGGQVIVSKGKADEKVFWKDLKIAFQEKLPVEGKFISSNKGGFEVNLGHDIIGFCPLSKSFGL